MAHALWAAATGRASAAPAFVADSTHDGRTVFRYAMPDGAPGEGVASRTGTRCLFVTCARACR